MGCSLLLPVLQDTSSMALPARLAPESMPTGSPARLILWLYHAPQDIT